MVSRRIKDEEGNEYGECDACGKTIQFGNALVALNRNIEQIDASTEYPGGEATVLDSQVLLTLCANCGSQIDADQLRDVLVSLLVRNVEDN